jgi:hypothetical protein
MEIFYGTIKSIQVANYNMDKRQPLPNFLRWDNFFSDLYAFRQWNLERATHQSAPFNLVSTVGEENPAHSLLLFLQ